ncbi:MAG: hypothetical protein AAFX87_20280 [Bacteroidota bacterium]
MNRLSLLCLIALLISSCSNTKQKASELENQSIKSIDSPASARSSLPFLSTNAKSDVYLSWVEAIEGGTHQLKYSKLNGEQWSAPQVIASGNNWFVNWADFPSVISNGNSGMIAHFLAKSGEGKYAYDVRLTQATGDGSEWENSFKVHDDQTASEHGFVTILPWEDDFFVTWLDGRNTVNEPREPMSIRTASIGQDGTKQDEKALDLRVCDCCQTSAAITTQGPIVVYRDRSEEEIRDLSIVRYENGEWTEPEPVHQDGWEINGCPVNGPKADAIDNHLAVAWFTAANGEPKVKLAFSDDSGQRFESPIQVNQGITLGRVDLAMIDPQNALISWLETADSTAVIKAVRIDKSGQRGQTIDVATTSPARSSGFPQMTISVEKVIFAWTEVQEESTQVRTAWVDLKEFN